MTIGEGGKGAFTGLAEREEGGGRPADSPVRCGTSMFGSNDPIVTPISDATAIVTTDARMPPGRRVHRRVHVRHLSPVTWGRGAARTGT